ncbi:MAG: hypothetical protein ACRDZR_11530 [Acidimicrobiales bacterium]
MKRTLRRDALVQQAASLLKTEPEGVVEALQRLLDRQRATDKELSRLRSATAETDAAELATSGSSTSWWPGSTARRRRPASPPPRRPRSGSRPTRW